MSEHFSPTDLGSRPRASTRRAVVRAALALVVVLLATGASPAVAADSATAVGLPAADDRGGHLLDTRVLVPPRPVRGTDKRVHLVYEMLLHNVSGQPVRVDRVQVRDPDRRRVVAAYRGRAVERLMFVFQTGAFGRTLGPGESGFLLLDVTTARGGVPSRLAHRIGLSVRPDGASPRPVTITAAATGVDRREPVRLAPPLRGGNLAVLGCCGPPFAHRLALFDFDGRLLLAQRYAIDFVRLDDGLNTFAGDPARNGSYFIFGDDVTAVAPGRVVATRDGVPENTPPNPPSDPGVDDLVGNFVLQDIGGGRFALYAHLQTGSVRLRTGDRLARGQVLGRVGNTGNSTEPHLHFQVTDGAGLPSALAANGVPYVFHRLRLDSRIAGLDSDPPAPVRVPAPPPRRRVGQYPLTGDVVAFPGTARGAPARPPATRH